MTPQTIDPNYNVGFVWTRQYGFRVTKTNAHSAFGVALEQPQLLYTASLAGNTPYAVIGSDGTGGGNYSPAISTCTPATSIVNYTNQLETDSAGNTIDVAVPVYKTVNGCANVASFSFNQAPDVIVKAAFDPGWGHYEVLGIAGFAHETVYPGETTNSNLYGGNVDIVTGTAVAPALTANHRSGRFWRQLPRSNYTDGHLRRQGPLRSRRRPLRRLDAGRRDCKQLGRPGSHPQRLNPVDA
jgi:hypothetical protein